LPETVTLCTVAVVNRTRSMEGVNLADRKIEFYRHGWKYVFNFVLNIAVGNSSILSVKFEVFMAVKIQVEVFWVIMLCNVA